MAAIKKDELERLEKKFHLEEDGLSYQHRCSRITAYLEGHGGEWEPPSKQVRRAAPETSIKNSPLYGKKILLTPLMVPDAKRNLAFDEPLGPQIVTRDYNAGEAIYGAADDVQRMVGDYEIVHVDKTKQEMARTWMPKIGTEIFMRMGIDPVPVVRGNDGSQGYIWSFPTTCRQIGDTLIQIYGLKTLVREVYPELEPAFSGRPMMKYIDGFTLAADIQMTKALFKKHVREEMMAEKAGFGDSYGGFGN